mmetsp:Transcript_14295/g.48307  ORF Transcript_14295/g.48307 Transcript_14295/m.48307 type:complete len:227 (-) Transcript_14295:377-1057(-)
MGVASAVFTSSSSYTFPRIVLPSWRMLYSSHVGLKGSSITWPSSSMEKRPQPMTAMTGIVRTPRMGTSTRGSVKAQTDRKRDVWREYMSGTGVLRMRSQAPAMFTSSLTLRCIIHSTVSALWAPEARVAAVHSSAMSLQICMGLWSVLMTLSAAVLKPAASMASMPSRWRQPERCSASWKGKAAMSSAILWRAAWSLAATVPMRRAMSRVVLTRLPHSLRDSQKRS